jgi:nitrite reductase (NO-forming)
MKERREPMLRVVKDIAQEDMMTTQISPDSEPRGATSDIDYHEVEGFAEEKERAWRSWVWVGIGLAALVGVLAVIFSIAALARGGSSDTTTVVKTVTKPGAATAAPAKAPTLADSKGVAFEKFQPVDPTLPAVPPGAVKKFTVDVMQHVTQVDPNLAPTEAWTYTVNGKAFPGTAASPPIVVNQGDKVQITFVNGGSKKMGVTMAHSIDFHSAEVAPNKNYIDVAPGKKITIDFVAKHPGVFMYHCATQPILMHTSAGMMGMMVVKPRNLAPVDKELWMTQEEFYLGAPGKPADMNKMAAETPDVMAFNGYANQYKADPITVRKGEKIRMYVLDAGPSKWSAFHVIGTVFDRTVVEGTVGHDSQTVNLAPSQGGWVEFTLDQEGNYPFVTHSFGDMVKGAAGILHTSGAPKVAAAPKPAAAKAESQAAGKGVVQVTMGDMWIKTPTPTVKAGKVTFQTKNLGAAMHGLGIVKAPAKIVNGEPVDMLGEGKHLMGGQSDSFSVNLKPGKYELVCHMPGHYAAGQHIPFTVQ